eukprot:gene370-467_t
MICSISGNIPEEPVVSIKTGNIYEKRLIEKYIDSNGKEPVSGEPLSMSDLVTVKVGKTVKPRPTGATSIPSMLQLFQNEWDSLMLETFTLKQQYETVRQELAHSLYQYDAACRVIARLIKERDSARNALANSRFNNNNKPSEEMMDVDSQQQQQQQQQQYPTKLKPEIEEKIHQNSQILIEQRQKKLKQSKDKQQNSNPDLPTVEDISKNFSAVSTVPTHKSGGIQCVDIHPSKMDLIVTGGIDSTITIFNRSTQKSQITMTGHTKRVNKVKFHPTQSLVFSCSQDKTVRAWGYSDKGSQFNKRPPFKKYLDDVTGISLHPLGDYLAACSLDRTWDLFDINSGEVLLSRTGDQGGYQSLSFHPDGMILATGSQNRLVSIWEVNKEAPVATLEGHTSAVNSISFSENGYMMATSDSTTVKLWDLRKLKEVQTINADQGSIFTSVSFDFSGNYLAIGGTNLKICNVIRKAGQPPLSIIKTFNDHTDTITDLSWSQNSSFITTTSLDNNLKIWSN